MDNSLRELREAVAAQGKKVPDAILANSKRYIEIRLLRNVGLFDLITVEGHFPQPNHTSRELPIDYIDPRVPHRESAGKHILQQIFDLEMTHKVKIPDVDPRMPKRQKGEPEGFYQKRVEAEWNRAIESRKYSKPLRDRLRSLADEKTIEIVSDPFSFLSLDDVEDDSEDAAIEKDK